MRVFIADDSIPVRELLVELLSEFSEIEVVGQSADALEAMELIRKAKPDVVILDMRLQRGSGMGLLGAVKNEMPGVVVMVLSGQTNPAYRQMCLNMGVDCYIHKSDGLEGLVQAISRLMTREAIPGQDENRPATPASIALSAKH